MSNRRMSIKQLVAFLLLALLLSAMLCERALADDSAAPIAEHNDVLLVSKFDSELSVLSKLLTACNKTVDAVLEDNYTEGQVKDYDYIVTSSQLVLDDAYKNEKCPLLVGGDFRSVPGVATETLNSVSLGITWLTYTQTPSIESKVTLIVDHNGREYGKIDLSMERSYPFAIMSDDAWYAPYYNDKDISILALGGLMQEYFGVQKDGTMYLLLNESYPFSDFGSLCDAAECFYDNALPFLIRIMPVYDNLDYPAFLRYAQVLRYMQSLNGTIVLNDPLVAEREMEREPLEAKMQRFYTVLDEQELHWFPMEFKPYEITLDQLFRIQSSEKSFGTFPFDTMIVLSLPNTAEELDEIIDSINSKWLSIGNYRKKFTNVQYIYDEQAIEENYTYVEEEQTTMNEFFTRGDEALFIIVFVSLIVFASFLIGGYRLYKRKFY